MRTTTALPQSAEERLASYRSRSQGERSTRPQAWTRYAAATGAAVAGAHSADAMIIHVVPPNPVSISINTMNSSTNDFVALDIDGNGVNDLEMQLNRINGTLTYPTGGITYNTFADLNSAVGYPAPGGAGQWMSEPGPAPDTADIRLLLDGDTVSSGQTFGSTATFAVLGSLTVTTTGGFSSQYSTQVGQWPTDGTGLAGVQFDRGGANHFGWIRLRFESAPGGRISSVEALEWAWEDRPDTAIPAGVVPEPTGLAMLAAGAAGVAALRSRN
ncbi:MAG: PEP-CTERM sorting domain-containing protein [Planctomycetota bacterium]